MSRVSSACYSRRSRFRVLVAALVASAQLAVVSLAPLADAKAGANAPSHVEEFGTRLHFAHNPDDCAACAAQSLVGMPTAVAAPLPEVSAAISAFALAAPTAPTRATWRPDAARAPPLRSGARSLS